MGVLWACECKQKWLARQIIARLWCPVAFNIVLPRVGSCTLPQVLTLFSRDSMGLAVCTRDRMNSNTAMESKNNVHSELIDLTDLRPPPPSIHSGFNTLISHMLACAHLCELPPSSCRNFPGPDFSEGRVPVSVVFFNKSRHGCSASCEDHQTRHFLSGFMYEFLRQ